jgi:hypothetical protein
MRHFGARRLVQAGAMGCVLLLGVSARAENQRVCVDIALKQGARNTQAAPPPATPDHPPGRPPDPVATGCAGEADAVKPWCEGDALPPNKSELPGSLPIGQKPLAYMKRLIEHFVSHEKGFVAVSSGCTQTIRVELYPLVDGWTAFASYTGTGREERVDRLLPGELSAFAERVATSLLYGKPLSTTINRENVLASDSKEYAQRIRGQSHFIMGLGTQLRLGTFATAVTDHSSPQYGHAEGETRFFSPVLAFLGYRGRYESWGLEAAVYGALGTTGETSIQANPYGGHVDFPGDLGLQMHFLRYFDPRGLTSFYLGAGSTFELLIFQAINPAADRHDSTRSYLLGGGVDVDAVLGWEFMRASGTQFFLQAEAGLPAYALVNKNDAGALHTWFPAVTIKLGMMF